MGTAREMVKTALRVPPALHQRIHEEAKKSERSFNAEILYQLAAVYGMGADKKEAQR